EIASGTLLIVVGIMIFTRHFAVINAEATRHSSKRVGAMTKNRQTRNSANWRICGAATLLVADFIGFADARTETVSRLAQVTAITPDGIRDQVAVGRATTPARPWQESSLIGNPLWGIALSSLQETRARPIFSPSRRPPSPHVVVAP